MKYEITKEQILKLANKAEQGCTSVIESDLKNWFPDVFKTEFKVGTVYKIDKNIFYCTEINERGVLYGYGLFNAKWGERFNDGSGICACNEVAAKNRLVEASIQEWESALINEAKKRGYKQGITCAFGKGAYNRIISENEIRWVPDWQDKGALCMGMNVIFTQGNWVEILSQEKTVVPMDKALKIIAKKMKVSPENIEIQY